MTITITGDALQVSDGSHTFEELYLHRYILWMALCRHIVGDPSYDQSRQVWKSVFHSDGSSYDGYFLLGLTDKEDRQMSYHIPLCYWSDCEFATPLPKAPEFDGHTSADVLKRISEL